MIINNHFNAAASQSAAAQPPVDESKFIPQGELPEEALKNTGEATIFYTAKSPTEAWDEYLTSTTGSMIEVSSTIPAGYSDVSNRLSAILKENGVEASEGMTIRHGIPEPEEGEEEDPDAIKEPQFIVGGLPNKAAQEQVEAILNSEQYAGFEQRFLALDKLTASENISNASQRDALLGNIQPAPDADGSRVTYGYQQQFAMQYSDASWQMDTQIEKVELLRIEKIAGR
ncbi:hypothetical protein [Aliamphritea hakodatensis]|uniref:hypothetical protein n=1 Tax=Aliamphritea hakodatensis TaxID=2895352 RepID=UPI0022FD7EAA|nr:hypothetical protein [Aliamphritea hakodatensis]